MRGWVVMMFAGAVSTEETVVERQRVDGEDRFGDSVGVSGSWMVVGAGPYRPAAMYERKGDAWEFVTSLGDGDASRGSTVAIRGDIVVVASTATGVYVHHRVEGQWRLYQQLTPPDDGYDTFGTHVAITDDVIAVGVTADGPSSDVCYLYRPTTKTQDTAAIRRRNLRSDIVPQGWTLFQTLAVPAGADRLQAFSLAVESDSERLRVVVGVMKFKNTIPTESTEQRLLLSEHHHPEKTTRVFSTDVYVFDVENDVSVRELPRESDSSKENFGNAVAIAKDLIVVGCSWHIHDGLFQGAAYVYSGDYKLVQKLVAPDGKHGAHFGRAVAVSDDVVVVGANHDGTGSAYVFTKDSSWRFAQKLTAEPTQQKVKFVEFGRALALDGDTLVAGAFYEDPGKAIAGAVYDYRLLPHPSSPPPQEEDPPPPSKAKSSKKEENDVPSTLSRLFDFLHSPLGTVLDALFH